MDTATGDLAALEVYQDTAGADAFMQFHVAGDYGKYFGLHGGVNDFGVGGWTAGAVFQRMFHDGYHPNADTWTTARTLTLSGAVTGSVSINGSGNVTLATTATADPTLTLSGDATGSATFTNLGNATLSVAVVDDSHNHSSSSGDFTVGGGLVVSGDTVTMAGDSNRAKYRVWNGGAYAIGMQNSFTFGALNNNFAMTFQMNNDNNRGWWWGDDGHNQAQGAMSLSTQGKLSVAHSVRLGYGEGDTTIPGATYQLDVSGNALTTGTQTAATFNATSSSNGGFQGIDADSITQACGTPQRTRLGSRPLAPTR